MAAINFVPRLAKPERDNKYYNRKQNGGYSDAILGSPTDKDCNVLSNCVGYAYGRFNEIGNWGYCKYLAPVNAKDFIKYKGDCEVGQTAKVGACAVWDDNKAGHVAIVEKVISDTEIITSDSVWGGAAFLTRTRKKGNGDWSQGMKFLGFIYNPAELIIEEDKMYTVYIDIKGYNSASDAAAGKNPVTTIKKGEYYMFNKYPNGYGGMYNITNNPASAGSWINPADNKKPDDTETLKKENTEIKKMAEELKKQVEDLKNETNKLNSKIAAAIKILE